MISLLMSGGIALMVSLIGTPLLIRWLQANGIGQQIREDGPQGHITKAGTPTMGGLMIVTGAFVGYVLAHFRKATLFTRSGIAVILLIVGCGLVGLLDDWIKVRHQRSLGLSKRAKFGGQLVVAIGFAFFAHQYGDFSTMLSFTRFNSIGIDLHAWGWGILAVVMILGASNAVNLTDGLDGLAAGSSVFAFSAFAIIGFWQFRHSPANGVHVYNVHHALDLALIASAMVGASCGFLWWNAAPARIFMGDTGALAIGAGLAGLALATSTDLLLPMIGGLFVLVTLSVMIQVASFRLFHRRVFRMAPLHHHFELVGWPETTVVVRFWILAGLCTAMGVGVFYADFIRLGLPGS